MENYTLKEAIAHHGNISSTIRQQHYQCNIYIKNHRASCKQDNKVQQYDNTERLNIQIDVLSNTDLHMFNDTMQVFGFKQHVTSPTHKCGHTLDLIYSEINTELSMHNCIVHGFISDNTSVTIDTTLKKYHGETTEKTIRDTTKLTTESLKQNYTPPVIDSKTSFKQACDQFNEKLHKMLDRAASPK